MSSTWNEYFEKVKNRPVRPLLLKALEEVSADLPKTVLELGSGAGTDTLHLLKEGWMVTAVEKESAGIEHMKRNLPPELSGHLLIVNSSFEDLSAHSAALRKSTLVYASLSLPFCDAQKFPEFWKNIESCFAEQGVFAANFFGLEDDWVKNKKCTGHSEEDIRKLLKDFSSVKISEFKEPGKTALGDEKFWHVYDVVAKR